MVAPILGRFVSLANASTLTLTAVCFATAACASSKCGPIPIQASHSGQKIDIGSCGGGDIGAPVDGHPDALQSVRNRQIRIHVGEKLKFTYRVHSGKDYPHGAAVATPGVAGLVDAPASGSTIASVVGTAPGTTFVTIDPTLLCGDAVQRCAIAAVTVVP